MSEHANAPNRSPHYLRLLTEAREIARDGSSDDAANWLLEALGCDLTPQEALYMVVEFMAGAYERGEDDLSEAILSGAWSDHTVQ